MKSSKNVVQSFSMLFGYIPFVILLAVVIYPFRMAYKATPLISSIADIFEWADLDPLMSDAAQNVIYPRSDLFETFEDSALFASAYYPWEGRSFQFSDAEHSWETVKFEYEAALKKLHFTQVGGREVEDGFRIVLWERRRYGGMEGETVALIWNDGLDISADLLIVLGISR